jgi:DNA-binding NarL/FixJ family response regulator
MSGPERTCGVVVCDDQKAFQQVMGMAISAEPGLQVVGEAANGEEAIRVVSALQPDIVLLDVAMPVMDGLEALPLIRAGAPDALIVMLTGFGSDQVRTRALAEGADLFIEKGTNLPELLGQLRDLCRSGR